MKKILHKIKKQKGFTLIETLVAVAILMVAIAGPLNIAEKGLVSAANSKDQTIAAFLAEDMMEYVKNIRDGNEINSQTWLTNLTGSNCAAGAFCIAETATGNYTTPSITSSNCTATTVVGGAGGCQLYVTSSGYYTYTAGTNQKTPFYRTYTITTPTAGSIPSTDLNNIRLVTVRIYWLNGSLPNSYVLQSMIFNTHR